MSRYVEALAAIAEAERQGKQVLVHCAAGVRRTGAVIALYELLVKGRSVNDVYRELDRFPGKPVAESPLLPFLNEKIAEIAKGLVRRKVIAAVPHPVPLLLSHR